MSTFEKRLDLRQKIEKRILDQYKDTLDRTFEIIYETKAEVEWNRLHRFSTESNFVMIMGVAKVPQRDNPEDIRDMGISFTIPIFTVDTFTPYQIADAAKDVARFRSMMPQEQFYAFIQKPDFTYEVMLESLPSDPTEEPEEAMKEEVEEKTIKVHISKELEGFDLDQLDEDQLVSLSLTQLGK